MQVNIPDNTASLVVDALRLAARRYRKDAEFMKTSGREFARLEQTFIDQAKKAEEVARLVEDQL